MYNVLDQIYRVDQQKPILKNQERRGAETSRPLCLLAAAGRVVARPMLLVFDIVKKSKVNRSFQDVQERYNLNNLRPISSAGGGNVGKTS
jgi:hypothetical protein